MHKLTRGPLLPGAGLVRHRLFREGSTTSADDVRHGSSHTFSQHSTIPQDNVRHGSPQIISRWQADERRQCKTSRNHYFTGQPQSADDPRAVDVIGAATLSACSHGCFRLALSSVAEGGGRS